MYKRVVVSRLRMRTLFVTGCMSTIVNKVKKQYSDSAGYFCFLVPLLLYLPDDSDIMPSWANVLDKCVGGVLLLLYLFVILKIIRSPRAGMIKILWILFVLCVPGIGMLIYFLVGRR